MATINQIKDTNGTTHDIGCKWENIIDKPEYVETPTLHLYNENDENGVGGKIIFGNMNGDIEDHENHIVCIEEIYDDYLSFKANDFIFRGGPIVVCDDFIYGDLEGNASSATMASYADTANSATHDSLGNQIDTTYLTISTFDEFIDNFVAETDSKVTTTPSTSAYYLCGSTTPENTNGGLVKRSTVYVNTSGYLNAPVFVGNLSGNATTATTATNVRSNTTSSTYFLCGSTNASTNTSTTLVKRATVYVNPSGYLNAGAFYETSDERLKDFSNKIDVDLDKISKIKKHRFTWKDSENKKEEIGVSAQEIRELYPEIVSENEEGYLSVSYDKLAVVALAAIDKLHQENIELKERITALENKFK